MKRIEGNKFKSKKELQKKIIKNIIIIKKIMGLILIKYKYNNIGAFFSEIKMMKYRIFVAN